MDKKTIGKLIRNIATSGRGDVHDIEENRKIVLFNVIGIIAIANLLPLGIIAFIGGNLTLALLDFAVAAGLITIIVLLRKNGYHDFYGFWGVFITGVLFVYLLATGGANNTGHLWLYTFPLVTSFLLGSNRGSF